MTKIDITKITITDDDDCGGETMAEIIARLEKLNSYNKKEED